ncbi:MAG TPA: hypothetical protein VLG50_02435 [Candidatus Saccharimonadales bacterium]|nr:hypothetical protein [Candidatus Saccharimonadales bacterium]
MTHALDRIQTCIAKIIQNNSGVKSIFEEIYQQGGRVLLVGGAVRDCFLGCFGSDLDFEVYHLTFEQLEDILQKFGKVSFIGKSFGVLRLHGLDADWSIPRVDSYGRKPIVELDPNMSFAKAFRRRDVTINAMGIDLYSHELIDPFDGYTDLQNKILRSPDVTFFVQDPLRLFRVMQLSARFNMKVDETLSQVCRTMDISTLSCERIEKEFSKLFLKAYRPSIGLRWLAEIDRLKDVFAGVQLQDNFYDIVDCLAQGYDYCDEQKLFALWGIIAYNLKKDELHTVHIDQKISQTQLHHITTFLKTYIGSLELVHRASMISWYIRYVPLLAIQEDLRYFKWLAHWIDPYFTMEVLGMIASCYYAQEVVESFMCKAKSAKVLFKSEAPLITGQDLLDSFHGKELGDALKKAYEIQLNESISDKQKLLQKVLPEKN